KFHHIIPIVFHKFGLSMKGYGNFDANEFLGVPLRTCKEIKFSLYLIDINSLINKLLLLLSIIALVNAPVNLW
ncbi:MAG: hypothetical protein K8R54_05555, partial [Bacteroidales bacterium]|nr:hypothetical protein [Bacteroidales bacterium]